MADAAKSFEGTVEKYRVIFFLAEIFCVSIVCVRVCLV
jgi:hypothetical protein